MLEAQRSMGADFVVGGRLEQTKSDDRSINNNNAKPTKFVTGEESLTGLPPDVREMFVLLGESDFRVDISSTELRARQQVYERQAPGMDRSISCTNLELHQIGDKHFKMLCTCAASAVF